MDVQPYESPRPSPRPQHPPRHGQHPGGAAIPGMRTSFECAPGSETPIYDSLYAEYRRLFRALPGDRSGEEELQFTGFGTISGTGAASWRRHGRGADAPAPPSLPFAAPARSSAERAGAAALPSAGPDPHRERAVGMSQGL